MGFTRIKGQVHSLEEPTVKLMQTLSEAVKNGTLKGVQMIGEASFPQQNALHSKAATAKP